MRRAGELALDRRAAPWSIGPEEWFGEVERLRALFALRLPAGRASGLAERLAEEKVHVEILGSVMRVSPHLHTTEEDLERLFEALDNAAPRPRA